MSISPTIARDSAGAVELLKADHRAVEELFDEFKQAKSESEKNRLAQEICLELTIHTMIEEEIFYPALQDAVDDDIINEAYVEHDGAKMLVAEIIAGQPKDRFFDAKVIVLSEEIKHHVKEEEQRDGMFDQAEKAGVDLETLGEKLASRKEELKQEFSEVGLPTLTTRTMQGVELNHDRPTA